jgi:amino acid transporter
VSFLFYGNTATNSVAFAIAALQSARAHMTAGRIIGVALGLNTGACLLHSMSRKWGILVNSVLGYSKLMMLLSIILIGFIYMDRSVSDANFNSDTSFSRTPLTPSGVYRYAEALAFIIFPFGGFNQANYVSPVQTVPLSRCVPLVNAFRDTVTGLRG